MVCSPHELGRQQNPKICSPQKMFPLLMHSLIQSEDLFVLKGKLLAARADSEPRIVIIADASNLANGNRLLIINCLSLFLFLLFFIDFELY